MKLNKLEILLGTGLYSGFSPFASGTVGSVLAFGIYFIPGVQNQLIILFLIVIFSVIGIKLGTKFEKVYGKDPSEFTLDEFIGSWISLLFIPQNLILIISTFFLWRILDILKPFPANRLEKLSGGWGIMLDDIVSGLYTLLIMFIVQNYFLI